MVRLTDSSNWELEMKEGYSSYQALLFILIAER